MNSSARKMIISVPEIRERLGLDRGFAPGSTLEYRSRDAQEDDAGSGLSGCIRFDPAGDRIEGEIVERDASETRTMISFSGDLVSGQNFRVTGSVEGEDELDEMSVGNPIGYLFTIFRQKLDQMRRL